MDVIVTTNELQEEIGKVACSAISIDIESEPRMRKTGNPFMGVTKSVTLNGLLGSKYSNIVNNQLGREDKNLDFQAQRPAWFEYLTDSKVLGTNRNKPMETIYLAMKVQGSSTPIYRLNGQDIPVQDLREFLYDSTKPHTQSNLDTEVVWRTVKLSSIEI